MTKTKQTEDVQTGSDYTADAAAQPTIDPTLRWPACGTATATAMNAQQMALAILSSPHGWQSLGGDALDGHHRDGKPLGTYLADRCHALATDFTERLLELQGEHERALLAADAARQAADA
ncbi:MAG: hypothetical protein JSR48_00760 [Verrucomicrobia bacterium]|nr:hypothetical protein [Verrucomicrobiota bacterium]